MEFGSTSTGGNMDLVCTMTVFDHGHSAHLMSTLDGKQFVVDGLIEEGFVAYTIVNGLLVSQFPMPQIRLTADSQVMKHATPTWHSLRSMVDLCSGFGGLAQGAIASGFEIAVASDQNPRMLELYAKASNAPLVCGDFGDNKILFDIWKKSGGASVLSSGFSCQPFSQLGDGRSSADIRSNCLTKTLRAAYLLQTKIVILECVAPAGQDEFVRQQIEHFQHVTGFSCSQVDLQLSDVWPCRRHRTWWLLVSPEIGSLDLHPWPKLTNVSSVNQVIPDFQLWDIDDEVALRLDPNEQSMFGVKDCTFAKHLLNGRQTAQCALHAWGSQLHPCPCGCRQYPLSEHRLTTKGLHGCLVRTPPDADGETYLRHVHPNEAMGLNSMDPILDFGKEVKLTLSAVGQLAAPLQALWICGFVIARLDTLQYGRSSFDSNAQIQAFRAWLLMRCRQVWPTDVEVVQDDKLLAMVTFWAKHKDLSLSELLHPPTWPGISDTTISIAAVLDHMIRLDPVGSSSETAATAQVDDDSTPWMEVPQPSETHAPVHSLKCLFGTHLCP